MSSIILEAAFRSVVLAAVIWMGLKLFRIRNARVELMVWTLVLTAALIMPVLMRAIPAPIAMPSVIAGPSLEITAETAGRSSGNWLMPLYGVITGLLLLRWVIGLVLTHKLLATSTPATAGGYAVRVSEALRAPVSFGSTIFLPADYRRWSREKLQAVLAHERSHLVRGDFFLLSAAMVHRALFWFSPLAWWLPVKLSTLSETVSDGAAVSAVGDASLVAAILTDFAAEPDTHDALAMARAATVPARVAQLLNEPPAKPQLTRNAVVLIVAIVVPIIVLAAYHGGEKAGAFPKQASELSAADPSAKIVPPRTDPSRPNTGADDIYPAESRGLGEEGAVILMLSVDRTGDVTDAKITATSGFPRLDAAALAVTARWHFLPGTVNGEPTAMGMPIRVTFKAGP